MAVTVPHSYFEPDRRQTLLGFYEHVFGWAENPQLGTDGQRIYLRAPTNGQYITIRSSDEPMRTSGYEQLGVEVDSIEDLHALHERAAALGQSDAQVELTEIKAVYDGMLHTFGVRYLLPLMLEIQYFDPKVRETLSR